MKIDELCKTHMVDLAASGEICVVTRGGKEWVGDFEEIVDKPCLKILGNGGSASYFYVPIEEIKKRDE